MHDEGGVFVALLAESVELSNGIVESLLGEVASLVWRVEDLVVEHREVQCKAESDGVRGGEISLSDFGGVLICFKRHVCRPLSLLRDGELCEVSVVVALPVPISVLPLDLLSQHLHLVVEHLGLSSLSRGNQVLVKDLKNVFADLA